MNRFSTSIRARISRRTRLAVAAMAGVAAAAVLAGCGTGQVAQTTDQAPAVNGTEGVIGHLALRDVRIQAAQNGAFIEPGETVNLVFVVSNQSTDTEDELTGITSSIGKVSLSGSKKLSAGGRLIVGIPAGQDLASPTVLKDLRKIEDADPATATVTLDKPITNGLTYDFTFNFKQAGPIGLAVPISAGVAGQSTKAQSQACCCCG